VVTYFGSSGLTCYDFDGNVRWQFPLPRPAIGDDFGTGTSPALCDGLVVLARDQQRGSEVLALRVEDGSVAWRVDRARSRTSWSSPAIWRHGDFNQVVLAGSVRLTAYDLHSGRPIWFADGIPSFPATTPVCEGDKLVFGGWIPSAANPEIPTFDALIKGGGESRGGAIRLGSGNAPLDDWGHGNDGNGDGWIDRDEWDAVGGFWKLRADNTLLLRAGGEGNVTATHVSWRAKRGAPHVASPLLYRNRIYLIQEGGRITCLDEGTGQPVYEQERLAAPGPYYASPVAADGRLYLCSLAGVVTVLTAGDSPSVLASNSLGETTAASPAVIDSTLYVRTSRHLYAFGETKLP
jgi:outer membrane protein assembly factor BamB